MEELDPSKYHTFNMKHKKWYIASIIFLLIAIIPLMGLVYYRTALNRPAQGFKEASFEISEGESVSSIADRLAEEGLVNSSFLFKAHLIAQNLHTKIQAGVYRIPAGASVAELSELFQHGTNDVSITFLEGWRVEQYALEASSLFKRVDYVDFVKLAKEKEGMLFPDTYYFNVEVTEEEIIDALVENFRDKTEPILREKVLKDADLTADEVLILASIVEREVYDEEDRPVVAGILLKRWREGELIGADATTQYAVAHIAVCETQSSGLCPTVEEAALIDWWPSELTQANLDFDSPYNTRKNVGLPPKPICNPGISAIEAVLNAKESPYNFYLTDSNGITHYAITLEEHNRNIQMHL